MARCRRDAIHDGCHCECVTLEYKRSIFGGTSAWLARGGPVLTAGQATDRHRHLRRWNVRQRRNTRATLRGRAVERRAEATKLKYLALARRSHPNFAC